MNLTKTPSGYVLQVRHETRSEDIILVLEIQREVAVVLKVCVLRIRFVDDDIRFPGVAKGDVFPRLRITIHRTARPDDDAAVQTVTNVGCQITKIPQQRAIDVVILMRVECEHFGLAGCNRLISGIVTYIDPLRIHRIERQVIGVQGSVPFLQAVGQLDLDTIANVGAQGQRMRHHATVRRLAHFTLKGEDFAIGVGKDEFTLEINFNLILGVGIELQRFVDRYHAEIFHRCALRTKSLSDFLLELFLTITRQHFQILLQRIMNT